MSINWEQFREFLRHLGVEWSSEGQESPRVSAEPFITVLQRSREHEALYRVDWLATGTAVACASAHQRDGAQVSLLSGNLERDVPVSPNTQQITHVPGKRRL